MIPKPKTMRAGACFISMLLAIGIVGWDTRRPAAQDPTPAQEGIEVLARGPVHEAFAEPVVFDPAPGETVPAEPPAPIEELPSEQTIEGKNVAWIPGYWHWELDRKGFLWVSGFWRVIPPGRQWVPGYWMKVVGGSQWISGFWGPVDDDGLEYLPTPPKTVEQGPSTPAPSPNHFWVSGCWNWRDDRYLWRAGYWTVAQPNWIWVPAHFVWTPYGCVFVAGYWDYVLPRRGLLFAPVCFDPVVYSRPSFVYTPSLCVDVGLLTSHFFVCSAQRHYYFGDYYGAGYLNSGFQPWFAFHRHHLGYDPIFVHHHHLHALRGDRDWESQLHRDYQHRRDHEDARPVRSLAALGLARNDDRRNGRDFDRASLVKTVAQVSTNPEAKLQIQKVDDRARQEHSQKARDTQKLAEQRRTQEIKARDDKDSEKKSAKEQVQKRADKDDEPRAARADKPGNKVDPADVTKSDSRVTEKRSTKLVLPKSPVAASKTEPANAVSANESRSIPGDSRKSKDKTPPATGGSKTPQPNVANPPAPKSESAKPTKGDDSPKAKAKPEAVPKPESAKPVKGDDSPKAKAKPEAAPKPKPASPPAANPESKPRPKSERPKSEPSAPTAAPKPEPKAPPRTERKPDPPKPPQTESKGKSKK